jgi:hypothetical protein
VEAGLLDVSLSSEVRQRVAGSGLGGPAARVAMLPVAANQNTKPAPIGAPSVYPAQGVAADEFKVSRRVQELRARLFENGGLIHSILHAPNLASIKRPNGVDR